MLQDAILVVNTHATLINRTLYSMGKLYHDYAHTCVQLARMLMEDFLREVSSSSDNLAMNRIPSYLVAIAMEHDILTSTTTVTVKPLQVHLAYGLGSEIPFHVDTLHNEVGFLLTLPVIDIETNYKFKNCTQRRVLARQHPCENQHTLVVADEEERTDFHLTPNLFMRIRTKDVHYSCPSKPFIRDNTEHLCNLNPYTVMRAAVQE
jgi:hypothetical protein